MLSGESQRNQSQGPQSSLMTSSENNNAYRPLQNYDAEQTLGQSSRPNGYVHDPGLGFQADDLNFSITNSSSIGSCCHGGDGSAQGQMPEQDNGIYYIPSDTATADNPMTEQRFRQLQSRNPQWQRQPIGEAQSVHECRCRDCRCTACPVHPFNPAMNQQMQDIARSHPQQFMQMAYDSTPFGAMVDEVGTGTLSFNKYNEHEAPSITMYITDFGFPDAAADTDGISTTITQDYDNGYAESQSGPIFNTSSHRVFQYDNAFANHGLHDVPDDGIDWDFS